MKVTNAVWEERNLGVSCYEINVEKDDLVTDLEKAVQAYKADYVVVKVPTGMVTHLFCLQKKGFLFMETMALCHYNLREDLCLNSIQERMISNMKYEKMNNNDLDELYDELRKGMFDTDRISLDPHFSQEQANQRYIGWVKDELERGADIYKIVNNKNQAIGFFAYKDVNKNIAFPFLGGLYKSANILGLGFSIHYYALEEGRKRGRKKSMASYSSNNRISSALHMSLGYILEEQFYVFVKHSSAAEAL